jgi:hypothetical protein
MILNDELERTYKTADMAYFKGVFKHIPEGTEENHESHF